MYVHNTKSHTTCMQARRTRNTPIGTSVQQLLTCMYVQKVNNIKSYTYLCQELLERFLVLEKANVTEEMGDESCIEKMKDSCTRINQ